MSEMWTKIPPRLDAKHAPVARGRVSVSKRGVVTLFVSLNTQLTAMLEWTESTEWFSIYEGSGERLGSVKIKPDKAGSHRCGWLRQSSAVFRIPDRPWIPEGAYDSEVLNFEIDGAALIVEMPASWGIGRDSDEPAVAASDARKSLRLNDNRLSNSIGEVRLTRQQAAIMELFVKRELVTREALLHLLYQDDPNGGSDKGIDVQLTKIRSKIRHIRLGFQNDPGAGWRLVEVAD